MSVHCFSPGPSGPSSLRRLAFGVDLEVGPLWYCFREFTPPLTARVPFCDRCEELLGLCWKPVEAYLPGKANAGSMHGYIAGGHPRPHRAADSPAGRAPPVLSTPRFTTAQSLLNESSYRARAPHAHEDSSGKVNHLHSTLEVEAGIAACA